jgi:hypothetical protein
VRLIALTYALAKLIIIDGSVVETEVILDGGTHIGQTFDLKGVKRLDAADSVCRRCVFTDLRGYAGLGAGKYVDCRFENWRLSELNLEGASLIRCKFVNVKIRSLVSLGRADIVDFDFSG